jgi:hypothetical protein
MKDIDPMMKQTFLKDYQDYLTLIKAMEMDQIDICIGIEQVTNLVEDIADDMFIMNQDTYDVFILQRNEISQKNKDDKELRKAGMKEPHDTMDDRNQKRLILTQYDLQKHRKLLRIIKQIAYDQGWFR